MFSLSERANQNVIIRVSCDMGRGLKVLKVQLRTPVAPLARGTGVLRSVERPQAAALRPYDVVEQFGVQCIVDVAAC